MTGSEILDLSYSMGHLADHSPYKRWRNGQAQQHF